MSNKSSSKQHGLVGNVRPKSKMRKRKNKTMARERREVRLSAAKEFLMKAKEKLFGGKKAAKPAVEKPKAEKKVAEKKTNSEKKPVAKKATTKKKTEKKD